MKWNHSEFFGERDLVEKFAVDWLLIYGYFVIVLSAAFLEEFNEHKNVPEYESQMRRMRSIGRKIGSAYKLN